MPLANPLHIQLCSPLSPAECAARLAPFVDATRWPFNRWVSLAGVRCVIGRVTDRTLLVRRRGARLIFLQGVLRGTLSPTGSGTLISGKMGWMPQMWIFVGWLWICTFTAFMIFLDGVGKFLSQEAPRNLHGLGQVAFPAVIVAVSIGVQILARRLMREDAAFFHELFVRKCDAVSSNLPPSSKS
ncbi:MAG: hypothetical protein ACO1TE_16240 [Prosthecobacter sp.]